MKQPHVIDALRLHFQDELPTPKPPNNLEQSTTNEQNENEKEDSVERIYRTL